MNVGDRLGTCRSEGTIGWIEDEGCDAVLSVLYRVGVGRKQEWEQR